MVNYIQLACMLRTYRKCNPMVGFSKYEFSNKLLGSVTKALYCQNSYQIKKYMVGFKLHLT